MFMNNVVNRNYVHMLFRLSEVRPNTTSAHILGQLSLLSLRGR